jgi:hypothetical protein
MRRATTLDGWLRRVRWRIVRTVVCMEGYEHGSIWRTFHKKARSRPCPAANVAYVAFDALVGDQLSFWHGHNYTLGSMPTYIRLH